MKHTPGPWMAFDSGTMVITTGIPSLRVANLDGDEIDPDQREANANMIAASPDMLDALKKVAAAAIRPAVCVHHSDEPDFCDGCTYVMEQNMSVAMLLVHAAIMKAETL